MHFSDKFIGFVDILGFKELVKRAETESGMSLYELLEIKKQLASFQDVHIIQKNGPVICPCAERLARDLDFRLTQISDCAVVSAEASPAGVINLIHYCHKAVFRLLKRGLMCRGYITRGSIYHVDNDFVGSGYQEAYEMERKVAVFNDKNAPPFVEVSRVVRDFVRDQCDPCVTEMFAMMVKTDENSAAIFPFKRLSISPKLDNEADLAKARDDNEVMRTTVKHLIAAVASYVNADDARVTRKWKHYRAALTAQLSICDDTDRMLDMLGEAFSKS